MGAYLTQPTRTKETRNGVGPALRYGLAAMQGWRVAMEDAHNCLPELDEQTSLFAVYDGHGGAEVAKYCAKYLPEVILSQPTYCECKLHLALEKAFLAMDARLTEEEVVKELTLMANREPNMDGKIADEEDVDTAETALLHEEATLTIEELMQRYGRSSPSAAATNEPSSSDVNGEDIEVEDGGKKNHASEVRSKACSVKESAQVKDTAGSASDDTTAASSSGQRGPSEQMEKSRFFDESDEEVEKGNLKKGVCSGGGGDEDEDEDDEDDDDDEDEDGSELSSQSDEEYSSEADDESEDEDVDEGDMDEDVGIMGMEGKEEPGSDSGTTAVVALLRGRQLVVANAGDSRCVVSTRGTAIDMSSDHKPEDKLELDRIRTAGGKVTLDGRVNGGLNLSRAIGDHLYKQNKELPPEKQMISALPDVKTLYLEEEHDFMVIACDGIWNVLSSQEVVDFVRERLAQEDKKQPLRLSVICEELLDHCIAPDTSGDGTGCDNMTCIIIAFGQGEASHGSVTKRKLEQKAIDHHTLKDKDCDGEETRNKKMRAE
uniref:Protein phosphatase 1G n=1 Tax=Eptatretus burgeri TaxID=7764 RepID=A0A8C4PZJ7_EPTBU